MLRRAVRNMPPSGLVPYLWLCKLSTNGRNRNICVMSTLADQALVHPQMENETWGCLTYASWALQIFSRNMCTAEIVLLMRISTWNCTSAQSHALGTRTQYTYKVSTWNSHNKCDFWHCIFRYITLEVSRIVTDKKPWTLSLGGKHFFIYHAGAYTG